MIQQRYRQGSVAGTALWPALHRGRVCLVSCDAGRMMDCPVSHTTVNMSLPLRWYCLYRYADIVSTVTLILSLPLRWYCLCRYADIVSTVTLILSLPLRWYCLYCYADIVSAVTLILSLPLRCYFNKGRRGSDLLKRCFFSSLLQCTRVHFMKVLCCENEMKWMEFCAHICAHIG